MLSYGLKPSGLYRHRRGLGLHKVGYNGRRSAYPYRQACLPRQGKSLPDAGRSLQSCIFMVQESGRRYSPAIRTPPNPGLPQLVLKVASPVACTYGKRCVTNLKHEVLFDCLPYECQSGTSNGLFLPIYPPRSMRVVLCFDD